MTVDIRFDLTSSIPTPDVRDEKTRATIRGFIKEDLCALTKIITGKRDCQVPYGVGRSLHEKLA